MATEVAVLELSSFQIESLQDFKAELGMILNITPGHSERYKDFNLYKAAKEKLKDHADHFIDFKSLPKLSEVIAELEAYYDLKDFPLKGKFNLINLWFVTKAILYLGLDPKSVDLKKLKGEKYRLEKIAENIFNDAKSTNWASTLAAIESFHDHQEIILMIGGKQRSDQDLPSQEEINKIKNIVRRIICVGENNKVLGRLFNSRENFETLEPAVKHLMNQDRENKIIVYSPAFPSFDEFKNYKERGERFTLFVEKYR